jgi:caffeoyl-CoA O-methyltransferase
MSRWKEPAVLSSSATVRTGRPERYIKQLVSHLGHRLSTDLAGDGTGTIVMDHGRCTLIPVDGAIEMAATADDDETLARVEDVVGRHLVRFGGEGELDVTWDRPPAA